MFALTQLQARNAQGESPVEAAESRRMVGPIICYTSNVRAITTLVFADPTGANRVRRLRLPQQTGPLSIAGIHSPLLEELEITSCRGISDLTGLLRGCRTLKGLRLGGSGVGQAGVAGIHAPLLDTLDIKNCRSVTDLTGLLRGCRTLKELQSSGSGVDKEQTSRWRP